MERLPVARPKPKFRTRPKTKAAPRPLLPPLAVRPAEAARLLGVGRSHLYKLLTAGQIPSRVDGAARLIPYAGLVAYLDGLPLPSLATGPLLDDAHQQVAIKRAREPGEPDFAELFAERLESLQILSPDLGGKERAGAGAGARDPCVSPLSRLRSQAGEKGGAGPHRAASAARAAGVVGA